MRKTPDKFPSCKPRFVAANEKVWFYEMQNRIDVCCHEYQGVFAATIAAIPMKELARTVDRWRRWKAKRRAELARRKAQGHE